MLFISAATRERPVSKPPVSKPPRQQGNAPPPVSGTSDGPPLSDPPPDPHTQVPPVDPLIELSKKLLAHIEPRVTQDRSVNGFCETVGGMLMEIPRDIRILAVEEMMAVMIR